MKFRKKPVVVEAVQYVGPSFLSQWDVNHGDDRIHVQVPEGCRWQRDLCSDRIRLVIDTLEGEMTVSDGDWIITGVKGERYPCKPDIFAATYEAMP